MKKIKRIILFRFHENFQVCENHLKLIKIFNSEVDIYGLYGGPEKDLQKAKKLSLKHLWNISIDDPHWKWVNGDLCVRWWYKDFGKKINFDVLHLFEWDLILLDSIENQFAHIRDGVAITGLRPMAEIYNTWDWVASQRGRKEWLELKKYVQGSFGYKAEPLAGVFGGAALSKKFLEKYAGIEIPGWCNDEVRTPLFAQAFHMPVHDTNLRNEFFSASHRKIFSANLVYQKYANGVKSFHPVKEALNLGKILQIKEKVY